MLRHDCDAPSFGDPLQSFVPGAGDLQIVGIYQSRDGAPWWHEPACAACYDEPSCDPTTVCRPPLIETQPGTVHVAPSTRTLVLSQHDPTHWTVTAAADARLERVILNTASFAFARSMAIAPAGVRVEMLEVGSAIFEWTTPDDLAQPCETTNHRSLCEQYGDDYQPALELAIQQQEKLVARAEELAGSRLGAFHGCFNMSAIEFGD